ncbi:class I SAM-dependent methyltransferase [Thiolapillus brandeum]|uniref:Methyltransferase type 11 n=1 Tax=Thiolapillus brandeum TaxID=1076588 RepID=A0A7U6GHI0_9GAMM|nr:methyltransferase domain-containing protein [Thiolapillus brandeum]BAO43712.1 methyltransferase type 11 [Thiolapillus brandeum]
MKPVDDYAPQIAALNQWFESNMGKMVLEHEREVLQRVVEGLFGYYLLELSWLCNMPSYSQVSPIRSFYRISPCIDAESQLAALPEMLPVAGDSVDAVVLPHTLDFAVDPRQVLREVERILIPEGRVVIVGFNPYSLWGLRRSLPGASRRLPWRGHFISARRLQDWLSLLGFDTGEEFSLLFRPPWKKAFLRQRFPRLDSLSQRYLSRFSGVYVLVAVKRVSTLTPVGMRWKLRSAPAGAPVQPVANMHKGVDE